MAAFCFCVQKLLAQTKCKWRASATGFTQSLLSLCTGPWHPFSTVRSSAFPTVVGWDCRCFRIPGFVGISKKHCPEDATHWPWKTGMDTSVPNAGGDSGPWKHEAAVKSLHTAPHWSPQINFFVEKNKLHHSETSQGWTSAAAWCLEHANYRAVWAHLMDFSLPLFHNQHTNLPPTWWLPGRPETC